MNSWPTTRLRAAPSAVRTASSGARAHVRANTSDGAVQAGVPLTLKLQVFDADHDCAPVQGATVDIWHANASGLYSDESANGTLT